MKKFFTALRVLLCVWCVGLASIASAGNVWSTLSQPDRNARIVHQAQTTVYPYPSQLAGECKSFTVDVVRVASNQANGYVWNGVTLPPHDAYTRTLPQTADWNGLAISSYLWVPDSNVTLTAGNGYSTLPNAVAGSIIQMRIQHTGGLFVPHTAIVEWNDTASQTLSLIESNYAIANYTSRRTVSYSAFVGQLEGYSEYTIYQIK